MSTQVALSLLRDNIESAGIDLRRKCSNNQVSGNTITGKARAVFTIIPEGNPCEDNRLAGNGHKRFGSALADIFVDSGAQQTVVEGGSGGTIINRGQDTMVTEGNYRDPGGGRSIDTDLTRRTRGSEIIISVLPQARCGKSCQLRKPTDLFPKITYGIVPSGFVQRWPLHGAAATGNALSHHRPHVNAHSGN